MSITIDLNDALVQQAEQYARQHGQSLAALEQLSDARRRYLYST